MRAFLYVFPCVLSIAGCSTTAPYPNEWPKTATATDSQCADLTGSYENHGLRGNGDGAILLASVLFHPLEISEFESQAVSHVTFGNRDGDGLIVKAWVGDELLKERLLTAAESPCRDGRRVFEDNAWSGAGVMGLPFVAYSSIDRMISLASDRSMVIENKDSGVGWAGLFPMAGSAQSWYAFSRISPDSPGLRAERNSPRGVRSAVPPVLRLLPPQGHPKPSFFDGYMNTKAYKDAQACVDVATEAHEPLDPQSLALLGGRSTQAFLTQPGRAGALHTENGNSGERNASWVPGTHKQRIEKLHWQPPSVADRYVICLLGKGYRWDNKE